MLCIRTPIKLVVLYGVRLHIGIAGCITGHRRARVDQQDVPLCNWISGCVTGIRLRNRLGWSSVQNIYSTGFILVYMLTIYRKWTSLIFILLIITSRVPIRKKEFGSRYDEMMIKPMM